MRCSRLLFASLHAAVKSQYLLRVSINSFSSPISPMCVCVRVLIVLSVRCTWGDGWVGGTFPLKLQLVAIARNFRHCYNKIMALIHPYTHLRTHTPLLPGLLHTHVNSLKTLKLCLHLSLNSICTSPLHTLFYSCFSLPCRLLFLF